VSDGGPDSPHGKGQFWWIGAPIVKYRDLLPWELCKMAEPIDLPFGLWTQVGQRMLRFSHIRQVAPMCPHGRTHFRHLENMREPSVYGGDVPYVKLLWPLVIFGHTHLDSHTDSLALRAKYCIMGIPHNTAIFVIIIISIYRSQRALIHGLSNSIISIDLGWHWRLFLLLQVW